MNEFQFLRCLDCGFIVDETAFEASPPACTYCGSTRMGIQEAPR